VRYIFRYMPRGGLAIVVPPALSARNQNFLKLAKISGPEKRAEGKLDRCRLQPLKLNPK
jgi:hypothetical protein